MKRKLYQLIITQRNAHIFSVYLFSPIRLDEFFEVGTVGRRTFAARITYDFTDIFAHTVEDNDRREPLNFKLIDQIGVLFFERGGLEFITRHIHFDINQVLGDVISKGGGVDNIAVQLLAGGAPVRPGKVQEDGFVLGTGLGHGGLKIIGPRVFGRTGGDERAKPVTAMHINGVQAKQSRDGENQSSRLG